MFCPLTWTRPPSRHPNLNLEFPNCWVQCQKVAAWETLPCLPCPSSTSQGTGHGLMWLPQPHVQTPSALLANSFFLPALQTYDVHDWLCPSQGRVGPQKDPGCLGGEFEGPRAQSGKSKCRKFPWPHGLPTLLEVGEGRVWPRRSRVRPRARRLSPSSEDETRSRCPSA